MNRRKFLSFAAVAPVATVVAAKSGFAATPLVEEVPDVIVCRYGNERIIEYRAALKDFQASRDLEYRSWTREQCGF